MVRASSLLISAARQAANRLSQLAPALWPGASGLAAGGEHALLEGDAFRTLAFVAPAGIVITDEGGGYIFVNHQWARITGMTAAAARGDGWREAVHPLDRSRVEEAWTRGVALGEPYAEEYRVRHVAGETAWVAVRAAPITDAGGRATGYVGIVEDVTVKRDTAAQLTRRDEQLRLVLEALTDGVFDWDLELNRVTWSPRLCELLAFDARRHPPSPSSLTELAHPEDRERLQRALTQHLAVGTPLRIEVRLARGGGGYGTFSVSGRSARDGQGRPLRMYGAIADVSHIRDLERELERRGGRDRPRTLALPNLPCGDVLAPPGSPDDVSGQDVA